MVVTNTEKRRARKLSLIAIASLVAAGAVALLIRLFAVPADGVPAGDSVWQISWEIRFHTDAADAVLRLSPPWDTRHARVFSQNFTHPNERIQRTRPDKAARDIVVVALRPGDHEFLAEFNIHLSTVPTPGLEASVTLSPEDRDRYLTAGEGVEPEDGEISRTLDSLTQGDSSRDTSVDLIFEHVRRRIRHDPKIESADATTALKEGRAGEKGTVNAMIALLRAAKIPSRVVTGFVLEEDEQAQPHYWLEVYRDERWVPYDPVGGYAGTLPIRYVPFRRGGDRVYEIDEATEVFSFVEISRQVVPLGLFGTGTKRIADVLDLTRLPVATQTAIALLLMLPFGALITEIARNIAGVRTYGTFTPTLLALAIAFVQWFTAAITFVVVTVFGISGRALMPGLRLSRVPRLGIVFTMVAMSMALSASIMAYYRFDPSGLVVLLPIVILTTLVDRVYSVADESGIMVALVRLMWTIVVALLVLFVFVHEDWGHWVLQYPEIHFFTAALIILIGAYKGKRLADFPLFLWLKEPGTGKPKVGVKRPPHSGIPAGPSDGEDGNEGRPEQAIAGK